MRIRERSKEPLRTIVQRKTLDENQNDLLQKKPAKSSLKSREQPEKQPDTFIVHCSGPERCVDGGELTSSNNSTTSSSHPSPKPITHDERRCDTMGFLKGHGDQYSSSADVSDSFWEIGQYKRTIRRIENGVHACDQLADMVNERAVLEQKHAAALKEWAKKWADNIGKSSEYGSIQDGWLAATRAADAQAELHIRVKERLQEEVTSTIKTWQKSQYTSKLLGGHKEAKEMEKDFKQMQEPWAKKYDKVEKAKKNFHKACKDERTAVNNDKNAQGDTSVSQDQARKLADKVEKCREDREKTRQVYEATLQELTASNGKYMEDMAIVFEKCQDMEKKRINFFKDMLMSMTKCMNIAEDVKLAQIFTSMAANVTNVDSQADVKWWSQKYGADMPMQWPQFENFAEDLDLYYANRRENEIDATGHVINLRLSSPYFSQRRYTPDKTPATLPRSNSMERSEYSPEMRKITTKKYNNEVANAGGVLLMRSKTSTDGSPPTPVVQGRTPSIYQSIPSEKSTVNKLPVETTIESTRPISTSSAVQYGNDWGSTDRPISETEPTTKTEAVKIETTTNEEKVPEKGHVASTSSSPTDEGVGDEGDNLSDDGAPGVFVIALYDYTAREEDELTLSKGDKFEKLDEPDEQGWCKGRLNGRVGLYPAKYAAEKA